MIAQYQKDALKAQVIQLEQMIQLAGDDPLMGPSLQQRKAEVQAELDAAGQEAMLIPRTTLFFYGDPVVGRIGIDAAFTAKILDPFQQMVKTDFASRRHGQVGKKGPRKGERSARLMLTGMPRGSVGLELAQPAPEDMIDAQNLNETLRAITNVIEAAASDDDAFATALAASNVRILTNLREFFKQMAAYKARVRIVAGVSTCELDDRRVAEAQARVDATETEDKDVNKEGVFRGLTLDTWRFDFRPDEGELISGRISEDVCEEAAAAMALLVNKRSVAILKETQVTARNGRAKSSYELSDVRQL